MTRAVLPVMRAQGSGHVFTITSISGTVGVIGSGTYSASKFAVEGWMEVPGGGSCPFGITATIVQPGFFNTDFLDSCSVVYGDIAIEAYAEQSRGVPRITGRQEPPAGWRPANLRALLQLAESRTRPCASSPGKTP